MKVYVVRPTDAQFRAAIQRRDSIVPVKGARQVGKTSLPARGLLRGASSLDRDSFYRLHSAGMILEEGPTTPAPVVNSMPTICADSSFNIH